MFAGAQADALEVDVCILGAGILGLCTALALLREDERLRVALVDREVPCAGATGAGELLGPQRLLAAVSCCIAVQCLQ